MVNKTNNGDKKIKKRGFKRSNSPDPLLINEQKSKTIKIEGIFVSDRSNESVCYLKLTEMNRRKYERLKSEENVGNKENIIKRVKSDMVLTKHSSLLFVNKEDEKNIPWYEKHDLWSNMIIKTCDKTYKFHLNFLDSHPLITKKMRSVLFDWLIEVCEVYQLHHETYHLTIAYIDQYLSHTNNFPKNKFQLLGITSLFVAAKIEEIYPPRLADFTYVTDNTCSEEDILDMELDLMKTLNWYINPITSISWILIYLQVEYELKNLIHNEQLSLTNSEILQSSKLTNVHRTKDFIQIFSLVVRLIDLCSLDIEYNHFSKHILAASAILLYKSNWPVQKITGLNNDDLFICQEWMKPFYDVLQESLNQSSIPSLISTPTDEFYSIQTHNISIELLENVYEKRSKYSSSSITNRPFRDLLNHLSWLSEKNEITVIV